VFFGFAHLANPHGTVLAAVAIALEAGILLAAAYLNGRALWLPIGIHAGWNFTQGGIFGVAVSGGKVEGWLHGKLTGPWWLSGDEFGAEASVVAVVVCLSLAIPLLLRARKKGEWRPWPWGKKPA
jgi:hypothetical protein